MQTMYDKLGELLSETLDAGEIKFVKVERPVSSAKEEIDSAAQKESEATFEGQKKDGGGEKNKTEQKAKAKKRKAQPKGKPVANNTYFYKHITPELERAYRLLDINFQSTLEDAKKAYKDKLKYYHPDRYAGNEVLTKVATDKTRQIVEAFNMISDFLTK